MGNMSHWDVIGNWEVQAGGYKTEKCLTTSHMQCEKQQTVDLREHFSEEYLDTAPEIQVRFFLVL